MGSFSQSRRHARISQESGGTTHPIQSSAPKLFFSNALDHFACQAKATAMGQLCWVDPSDCAEDATAVAWLGPIRKGEYWRVHGERITAA